MCSSDLTLHAWRRNVREEQRNEFTRNSCSIVALQLSLKMGGVGVGEGQMGEVSVRTIGGWLGWPMSPCKNFCKTLRIHQCQGRTHLTCQRLIRLERVEYACTF